jgi:hypothetical protein
LEFVFAKGASAMHRIKLISDDECRADLGLGLMRWHRWQKKFSDLIPPPIVIEARKFRDRALWEQAKRKLIERSDPSAKCRGNARAARRTSRYWR